MSYDVARLIDAISKMASEAVMKNEPVMVSLISEDDCLRLESVSEDAGRVVLHCCRVEDGGLKDVICLDGDRFCVARDGSAIEVTDGLGDTMVLRFRECIGVTRSGPPLIDADCPTCRSGQAVSHLENGSSHFCEVCCSSLTVRRVGRRVSLVK